MDRRDIPGKGRAQACIQLGGRVPIGEIGWRTEQLGDPDAGRVPGPALVDGIGAGGKNRANGCATACPSGPWRPHVLRTTLRIVDLGGNSKIAPRLRQHIALHPLPGLEAARRVATCGAVHLRLHRPLLDLDGSHLRERAEKPRSRHELGAGPLDIEVGVEVRVGLAAASRNPGRDRRNQIRRLVQGGTHPQAKRADDVVECLQSLIIAGLDPCGAREGCSGTPVFAEFDQDSAGSNGSACPRIHWLTECAQILPRAHERVPARHLDGRLWHLSGGEPASGAGFTNG